MSLKTSFKAGFVLLGAISIGMAAPSSTSAQSCYSCLLCDYDPEAHYVPPEASAIIGVTGPSHAYCARPLNCLLGHHDFCMIVMESLPGPDAVRHASSDGATAILRRLNRNGFDGWEINQERRSLQVFGCGGQLLASYPLREDQLQAMVGEVAEARGP
jgi:hypothetical protein